MSSVLLGRHWAKFDEAAFRAAVPEGFVYFDERPRTDPGAPTGPKGGEPSLELLHDGFLFLEKKHSLEDGFNYYAEVLLDRPELLLEAFAPESRIGRKARIVRDFYISVDPRFERLFSPAGAGPGTRDRRLGERSAGGGGHAEPPLTAREAAGWAGLYWLPRRYRRRSPGIPSGGDTGNARCPRRGTGSQPRWPG